MNSNYSKEKLIKLLEEIKDSVIAERMPETTMEHVWDILTFSVNDPEYEKMLQYLFTGWFISTQLSKE